MINTTFGFWIGIAVSLLLWIVSRTLMVKDHKTVYSNMIDSLDIRSQAIAESIKGTKEIATDVNWEVSTAKHDIDNLRLSVAQYAALSERVEDISDDLDELKSTIIQF